MSTMSFSGNEAQAGATSGFSQMHSVEPKEQHSDFSGGAESGDTPTVMTQDNSEKGGVADLSDFPSIEGIDKKFFDEIARAIPPTQESTGNRLEVDLDHEDPVRAAALLREKLDAITARSDVAQYLQSTEFGAVEFMEVPLDARDLEDKRIALDGIIAALEKNKKLQQDPEFLKKLYKLKDIRNLVEEAIERKLSDERLARTQEKALRVFLEYRKQVLGYVKEKMDELRGDEDIKDEFKKLIDAQSYTKADLSKAQSVLSALQKSLEEYFAEVKNTDVLSADFVDSIVVGVEKIVSAQATSATENEVLNEKIKTLNKELASLKEDEQEKARKEAAALLALLENEKSEVEEERSQLKSELTEREKIIKELKEALLLSDDRIQELEKDNNFLLEQVNKMKSQNGGLASKAEEPCAEEEPKANQEKSRGKKFFMLLAGALGVLAILGLGVGYMTLEDVPAPAPQRTFEPAPAAVTPSPAIVPAPSVSPESAGPVVENKVAAVEDTYDFSKELSTAELSQQDFIILGAGNIEVNGKKFGANDIINGHKFIKATSEGRILFISPRNTPEWIGGE